MSMPAAGMNGVMMCLPQMMMMPPSASAEDKLSKYRKIDGFKEGMELKITTASLPIQKLPKIHW